MKINRLDCYIFCRRVLVVIVVVVVVVVYCLLL
jgi:hypothetical protein